MEPSNPDKWKCPICFKDARPYSLRIDIFLLSVRRQLEKEGKLYTKCVLVAADGK
jgi:zinc finger MIZ domain-containing protein